MARDVTEVQTIMDDEQAAQPALSSLNSTSQTAIYTIWKYITSILSVINEQLQDKKIVEIEAIVIAAPVGSEAWLQSKVFEFQYDSVVPQVLQLVNFAPQYNPVDTTKQIITRAAVITGTNKTVYVKVAKSDPPIKLTTTELASLQGYLTGGGNGTYSGRAASLGFAGVDYLAQSYDADKLYLAGTIYYNGQYTATIQTLVIDAINNYLAKLPYIGSISLLGITDAIQSVGVAVKGISLDDVAVRADLTAFGSKTYMRQTKTDIITDYTLYGGYVVEETTVGETFLDRLIFVAS